VITVVAIIVIIIVVITVVIVVVIVVIVVVVIVRLKIFQELHHILFTHNTKYFHGYIPKYLHTFRLSAIIACHEINSEGEHFPCRHEGLQLSLSASALSERDYRPPSNTTTKSDVRGFTYL